jgi:hypothetical protein
LTSLNPDSDFQSVSAEPIESGSKPLTENFSLNGGLHKKGLGIKDKIRKVL